MTASEVGNQRKRSTIGLPISGKTVLIALIVVIVAYVGIVFVANHAMDRLTEEEKIATISTTSVLDEITVKHETIQDEIRDPIKITEDLKIGEFICFNRENVRPGAGFVMNEGTVIGLFNIDQAPFSIEPQENGVEKFAFEVVEIEGTNTLKITTYKTETGQIQGNSMEFGVTYLDEDGHVVGGRGGKYTLGTVDPTVEILIFGYENFVIQAEWLYAD